MDQQLKVSIIAAFDFNKAIGLRGEIPWHLKSDMVRFAKLTAGHTVIVGRKTQDSIVKKLGGPLKNRTTIVVSRNKDYQCEGCKVVSSYLEALDTASTLNVGKEVFVIGGAEIYKMALNFKPYRMYITFVFAYVNGDTHFPELNWNEWNFISAENHYTDQDNDYSYEFVICERKESR